LIVLCLAVLTACNGSVSSVQAKETAVSAGEIGSSLPEFSAKTLQGRIISSADLRGKVVLVDFWATWCEPCKKEMPGYQKLFDRYARSGFAVVGLKATVMADTEDPLGFAKKTGVRYPLAVVSEDLMRKFGGLEGLPTTLLYDRQGILRKKVIGFEYTSVFESELLKLLAEKNRWKN